ncbi:hypothetical protein NDN08_001995 [Rhodosorus marinus]|uniref:Serine aminopeptidase S33 domain-containing protein n=1 Tax=Rhodosorus marinus TaxID=101924 RepID=A0AAV8UV94_9RHOD|nr:hypothetical protein NDN08_001995 [Rhodosorus marinus]
MIGFIVGGSASGFGRRIGQSNVICGIVGGDLRTDSSAAVSFDVDQGSVPSSGRVLFVPAIGASGRDLKRAIRGIKDAEVVRWRQESEEKDLKELVTDVLEGRKGSKWTVVAESTGGTLALMMASKGREEIEKLVLVNPVTSPRSEIAKIAARAPAPLQRIFSAIGPMSSTSMKTVSSSNISFADSQLSNIKVPVTIVVSEDDILQPSYAESERLLNLIPQAVRCVLPSGGHFLLSENRILLSQILLKSQHIFNSAKIPHICSDCPSARIGAIRHLRLHLTDRPCAQDL